MYAYENGFCNMSVIFLWFYVPNNYTHSVWVFNIYNRRAFILYQVVYESVVK